MIIEYLPRYGGKDAMKRLSRNQEPRPPRNFQWSETMDLSSGNESVKLIGARGMLLRSSASSEDLLFQ